MGASEEGEMHLVMDANVFKSIQFLLSFYLIYFSFKRLVGGHCPSVVTSGGNVTHNNFTEMRRLAHDETPFLLAMPQRTTTLAWWPAIGSVIPLHAHGPNRSAHDETSYPPTRSWVLFYFTGPLFLLRSHLLLSRGSLGKASQGFIFYFNFFQLLYPLGLYPLLPTRQGTTLPSVSNPNSRTKVRGYEKNEY